MELNSFKEDVLVNYKDNLIDVVRKNLINGSSYFFEHQDVVDDEYLVKKDLSDKLNIHPNNIIIVGSAKLGFSIKPEKSDTLKYNFLPFRFESEQESQIEESDIDIAIIDAQLFEKKLEELYTYIVAYDDTKITEYFDDCSKRRYQKKCFYGFSKYILMGWLRPDKMPNDFQLLEDVAEIRDKYRKRYNRKVNIGIYKSWFYFENYNLQNLKNMQSTMILKDISDD